MTEVQMYVQLVLEDKMTIEEACSYCPDSFDEAFYEGDVQYYSLINFWKKIGAEMIQMTERHRAEMIKLQRDN